MTDDRNPILAALCGGGGADFSFLRSDRHQQARLYLGPSLDMGGADYGVAITGSTVALCKDISAALVKHGFEKALLVLDAEEVLEMNPQESSEGR